MGARARGAPAARGAGARAPRTAASASLHASRVRTRPWRHPRAPAPQVRDVCACALGVLTSSRDKTVKIWAEDGACFSVLHTLVRRRSSSCC